MMLFAQPAIAIVRGRRVAYEEVVPPDPAGVVVLLAGLGAKRQGWYKQMQAFGSKYRTIAVDYRDVGDSDPTVGAYSIGDIADELFGLMQALTIGQAHLVGVSMGGFIAMELVLRNPAAVARLVLVGTSAGGPGRVSPSRETMAMMMPKPGVEIGIASREVCAYVAGADFTTTHSEELDLFAEIARHSPMTEEAYFRQLDSCRGHDVSQRLGQITVPTLVIHGAVDPLVPLENGRHLANNIADARLIVYPTVGHIPEVECAEQFNQDVLAFLGGA